MVYPFSATPAVAEFIRTKVDPKVTFAAYTDYCAAPIAYWLDRPIYSISMGREVYVNTQDDRQRFDSTITGATLLLNSAYQLLHERKAPVLLMLNSNVSLTFTGPVVDFVPGPNQPVRHVRMVELTDPGLQRGVVQDENHSLYLVDFAIPGLD